jgi:hypothetical protein
MAIASGMKEMNQGISSSYQDRVERVEEIKEEGKQTRVAAQNLMKEFQRTRKKAGIQLRKDLAKETAQRKSEVNKIKQDAQRTIKGFRTQRKSTRAKQKKELTKSEQPKAKPPVSDEKVELPVAGEEATDLEAKLLAAINEHPNGITLTEIAENLGVVPIVLGRASKSLVESGKIFKEDKLYFPVVSK